jgi:thymidylate kinase
MEVKGIIVLEGPDASGKSTLANAYAEKYGAKIIHATYQKDMDMPDYHDKLLQEAVELSKDGLVIMDRLHLSEMVYAKVFRGGTPWPMHTRMFDKVLMTHSAINILCLPDTPLRGLEWFEEAKKVRPEMYDNIQGVTEEYFRYLWQFLDQGRIGNDYMGYNRDKDKIDSVMARSIRMLREFKKAQHIIINGGSSSNDYCYSGHKKYAKVTIAVDLHIPKVGYPLYNKIDSEIYSVIHDLKIPEHTFEFIKYDSTSIPFYDIFECSENKKMIISQGNKFKKVRATIVDLFEDDSLTLLRKKLTKVFYG